MSKSLDMYHFFCIFMVRNKELCYQFSPLFHSVIIQVCMTCLFSRPISCVKSTTLSISVLSVRSCCQNIVLTTDARQNAPSECSECIGDDTRRQSPEGGTECDGRDRGTGKFRICGRSDADHRVHLR